MCDADQQNCMPLTQPGLSHEAQAGAAVIVQMAGKTVANMVS
jgi:hypothetical protein